MGIYVQQNISEIDVVFSGIWANQKSGKIKVCHHEQMVFLGLPQMVFQMAPQIDPAFIRASLPENLWPNKNVFTYTSAVDTFAGPSTITVIGIIQISALDGSILISVSEGGMIPTPYQNDNGPGGFNENWIYYQKRFIERN